MPSLLETFATRFARCVDLFRDPAAKEAQKAEFRAIMELLRDAPVTLRVDAGRLEVNGVPCAGQKVTALLQRLDLHGVGEIALAQSPPPEELFELFRVLADQPGVDDVPTRLGFAGATRIHVTNAGAGPHAPSPPQPPPPVSRQESLRPPEPVIPSPEGAERAKPTLGTKGVLRGEAMRDIQSVPITGVPMVTHDPLPPPADRSLPTTTAPPPTQPPEELSLSVARQPRGPPPPAPPPPPPPSATAPPARATERTRAGGGAEASGGAPPVILPQGVEAALAELEHNPGAPGIGDQLAGLVEHAAAALRQGRPEQMLAIIARIQGAEQRVPAASGVRRQYGIALKRLSTKPVLEALARLVAVPRHRTDAAAALRRGGADAVELLMGLLIEAPTVAERRAVFDALRQMTEGTEQLVHLLEHREWFVVRNVAELIGELGMDDAVPALASQLDHEDERVRKAVALALAKIGTRGAAEPLRRALRDKSPEVRMQVALGIGGRKSFALAMPLVVAMEEEEDEAVERELVLALGRIGSPDAIQALIKFAQPAVGFFSRKSTGLRLAAVEALRLAGTGPAVGTLQGLADDGDREVRAAARAALTELKRKPRG